MNLLVLLYFLPLFSQYIVNPEIKYRIGNYFLICLAPIFIVNLSRVVYIVMRPFVIKCKKRIKKKCVKKRDQSTQKGEYVAYMKA